MDTQSHTEHVDTLVIGGGQAGLSIGYHLARRDLSYLVLDASERIGGAWRGRWDSLRLFTSARYNGLDGMPFPASPHYFPTKDEMADYLERYAAHFEIPVVGGTRVARLTRPNGRFVAYAGQRRFEADNVVVAMSSYQRPQKPWFAGALDPSIRQLHSADYRSPNQLREGPVLLVGAGNSGADIAMELAPRHQVWMSGRDVGEIPFRIEGFAGRHVLVRLVLEVLFHRVLTVRTPIGRKARPKFVTQGGPLVRVKTRDLDRAGVERVPRIGGVEGGLPVVEDGRVLEPANVIWCTGFDAGFDWINVPGVSSEDPQHESGIVKDVPGLYFVGLEFLHSVSSSMVHGVGRDAARIARDIAKRRRAARPSGEEVREGVAA